MIYIAVTKLWKINSNLKSTMEYVKNKDKTFNSLQSTINYATNTDKTEKSFFVTGINCDEKYAFEQMNRTKKSFNKTGGVLGYHGYQSFKEGEVSPSQAHEIGIQLANEMWGDKYEVIVTTHLNTKCLHNHFVVNSVSFVDGKKFNSCRQTTAQLRYLNDSICNEHGLSHLDEKPSTKSGIDFSYYLKSDREYKGNYYINTKNDIDIAIKKANSYQEFLMILKRMNYEVTNRYEKLSVRNLNYRRNIRIERKFGEEYSIENIKQRIIEERENFSIIQDEKVELNNFKYNRNKVKTHGIVALYRYYCYLLKVYPTKNNGHKLTKSMYEDLGKMNYYNNIIQLFDREKIVSANDFKMYDERINSMYDELIIQRRHLRNQYKRIKNESEKNRILEKIKEINLKINDLKKNISICSQVKINEKEIRSKVKEYEENKMAMDKVLGK